MKKGMSTGKMIALAFLGITLILIDEIYAFVVHGVFSPKLWILVIMAVGIVTIWTSTPKKRQPWRG